MKRFLSVLLSAVFVLMLLPAIPQTASAESLSNFNIRLDEPTASYTPDFSPEFNTSAYMHTTVTWQENSPGFSAKLTSSDEFRAGLAYKVVIWIMLDAGNYFATDIYGDLAAAITVNGKAISSLKIDGRNNQGQINQVRITCEYDPLPGMEISSVFVKGIPTPVAGNMPIYSFTVDSNAYAYYHTAPVVWWDMTTGEEMDSSDTFIKGHKYQVNIWLQANREGGFTFKTDSNGNPQVNVTLNSWAADSVTKAYEQEGREVIDIRYTFPACQAAHTCAPKLVPQQDPTCLMPGFRAYYECSCGKCYEDAAGKKEITDMDGYGILAAHGHIEGKWSYNGTHHYKKCTVCTQVIPGTNAAHSGGTATCIQKAKCNACGYSYGSADTEHKWSPTYLYKDAKGHAWVCADCKTHSNVEPHTPGPAATETEPQKCKDCGYIIEPAKNHNHNLTRIRAKEATCTEDGNVEYYTCEGCSDWFLDPNFTQKVEDRNSVVLKALGHFSDQWEFSEDLHWQVCQICSSVIEVGKAAHEDEDGNDICDVCGYGEGSESQPQDREPGKAEATGNAPKKNSWLLTVLIALVCFSAAVTAAVIILKKKKGGRS